MQLHITDANIEVNGQSSDNDLIIKNLSLSLMKGDRMALLGLNGSGKSTLLNYINRKFAERYKIAFVRQNNDSPNNRSLLNLLESLRDDWWQIEDKLEKLFDYKIKDYDQRVDTLSGGELSKIHISAALVDKPQILLLDEPTNHLDRRSIMLLEKAIMEFDGILILVSHNQEFVERIANCFLELKTPEYIYFKGNWSQFQIYKQNLQNSQTKRRENLGKQIKKHKEAIETHNERSIKGYANKRKKFLDGSIDRKTWGGLKTSSGGGASLAISNLKNILNIKKLEFYKSGSKPKTVINFGLQSNSQANQTLVSLVATDLVLEGRVLLKEIDLNIKNGQRIGLTGQNGSGKSLLMNSIVNQNQSGYLIKNSRSKIFFNNLKPAFVDQNYSNINTGLSVVENMHKNALSELQARHWLASFRFFDDSQVNMSAALLSGGQKARLSVAKATINGCNLLVLDEPVNNLDIESQKELLQSLESFEGAIVCISHDKSFLRNLNVSRILQIDNCRLNECPGFD